ncbi:MAG: ABC-2 transporter permease [Ruminococcaceae bacterium]|nr:ABC-2 transporter permease [Oscillospiraceae bacterium]
MRGLLRKEWYVAAKHCRIYLLLVVIFSVVSLLPMERENLFFTFYPGLIAGMLPGTLLSYDEQSKWSVYSGTLPYTRAQLVSAKYVVGLCAVGCVWVLWLATTLARVLRGTAAAPEALLLQMALLLCLSLLAPSVTLPLMLHFGVEKGRIINFGMVFLFCVSSLTLSDRLLELTAGQPMLSAGALAAVLLAAAAVGYAVSWLVSIRLYRRREL